MDLSVNDLAEKLLETGTSLKIKAKGISMFPFLQENDILFITKAESPDYKIGDIVVFKIQEKFIAHRILKKINKQNGDNFYITKGDSQRKKDSTISETEILGKVIAFERKGMYFDCSKKIRKNLIIAKLSFLTPILYLLYRICRKLGIYR